MRLSALMGVVVVLAGCGEQSEYTTLEKEMQRKAGQIQASSAPFRRLAEDPPDYRSAQQFDAPFKPGYDVRGETAPLDRVSAVVRNIKDDWEELRDILAGRGEVSEELYDYPAVGRVADRLVMRGRELEKARKYELVRDGVTSDQFQPGALDENIRIFQVNAHKLQLAAYQRQPEELEAVIVNMPRATPGFFGGDGQR